MVRRFDGLGRRPDRPASHFPGHGSGTSPGHHGSRRAEDGRVVGIAIGFVGQDDPSVAVLHVDRRRSAPAAAGRRIEEAVGAVRARRLDPRRDDSPNHPRGRTTGPRIRFLEAVSFHLIEPPDRQRLYGMPAVADYDGPGDDRARASSSDHSNPSRNEAGRPGASSSPRSSPWSAPPSPACGTTPHERCRASRSGEGGGQGEERGDDDARRLPASFRDGFKRSLELSRARSSPRPVVVGHRGHHVQALAVGRLDEMKTHRLEEAECVGPVGSAHAVVRTVVAPRGRGVAHEPRHGGLDPTPHRSWRGSTAITWSTATDG